MYVLYMYLSIYIYTHVYVIISSTDDFNDSVPQQAVCHCIRVIQGRSNLSMDCEIPQDIAAYRRKHQPTIKI